ncbi:MAG: hypothetical protein ACPGXK_04505 [Phycisphaerae bacterium]
MRKFRVAWLSLLCVGTIPLCGGCGNDTALFQAINGLFNGDTDPADLTACGPVAVAQLVPDCPLGLVCFTPACEAHNICYADCDATQAKCDLIFYLDLLEICGRRFLFNRPNRQVCESLATVYALAVRAFGAEAYAQTQLAACSDDLISPFAPGVCCIPGEPCFDQGFKFECDDAGGSFGPFATCEDLSCDGPLNDDCGSGAPACDGFIPLPNTGTCEGDPTEVCFPTQPLCSDESSCLPDPVEGYFCETPTDNRLATTDGPEAAAGCRDSGPDSFQADVWYEYIAPCDGTVTLRMCGLESYDGMLSVHGTHQSDGTCVCPGDNESLLACDDDFCGGASTSAIFLDDVVEGACYLIRVGGWSPDGTAASADVAAGMLEITQACDSSQLTDERDPVERQRRGRK